MRAAGDDELAASHLPRPQRCAPSSAADAAAAAANLPTAPRPSPLPCERSNFPCPPQLVLSLPAAGSPTTLAFCRPTSRSFSTCSSASSSTAPAAVTTPCRTTSGQTILYPPSHTTSTRQPTSPYRTPPQLRPPPPHLPPPQPHLTSSHLTPLFSRTSPKLPTADLPPRAWHGMAGVAWLAQLGRPGLAWLAQLAWPGSPFSPEIHAPAIHSSFFSREIRNPPRFLSRFLILFGP